MLDYEEEILYKLYKRNCHLLRFYLKNGTIHTCSYKNRFHGKNPGNMLDMRNSFTRIPKHIQSNWLKCSNFKLRDFQESFTEFLTTETNSLVQISAYLHRKVNKEKKILITHKKIVWFPYSTHDEYKEHTIN